MAHSVSPGCCTLPCPAAWWWWACRAAAHRTCTSFRTRSIAPGWQVHTASLSAFVSTKPRRRKTRLFSRLQLHILLRVLFAALQQAQVCLHRLAAAQALGQLDLPVVVQLHEAWVIVMDYLGHQDCSAQQVVSILRCAQARCPLQGGMHCMEVCTVWCALHDRCSATRCADCGCHSYARPGAHKPPSAKSLLMDRLRRDRGMSSTQLYSACSSPSSTSMALG